MRTLEQKQALHAKLERASQLVNRPQRIQFSGCPECEHCLDLNEKKLDDLKAQLKELLD